MKKQITALILLICISASTAGFAADVRQSGNQSNIFTYLDVIRSGEPVENEAVTRAQFLVWAMRLFGYREDALTYGSEICFIDVTKSHSFYNYINTAFLQGIVSGMTGGRFAPDEPIVADDAAVILLNLLGYDEYIRATDGLVTYYQTALSLGLLNGVDTSAALDGAGAVRLLYNSLETGYMSVKKIRHKSLILNDNEADNVLSRIYKLKMYEGFVTSNAFSSVDGPVGCGRTKMLEVDYVTFTCKNDYSSFLAKRIIYFTDTEDADYIVYAFEDCESESVEISADNIDFFGESKLVYTNDGENTIYFNSRSCVLVNGIYKGRLGSNSVTSDDLMPKSGTVTLTDRDDDGEFDVILVRQFMTYTAASTSIANKIVFDRYGKQDLILEDNAADGKVYYTIIKNGVTADFSEILSGNVLSVAKAVSEIGTVYTIIVSDKTVTGVVTGYEYIGGSKNIKVYIDGVGYIAADDYYGNGKYADNTDEFVIGAKINACLTADGQIGAIQTISEKNKYAYLVGFAKNSGIDDNYSFKLFTADGNMLVFETDGKITVDGVKNPDFSVALIAYDSEGYPMQNNDGTPSYSQLIKYTTNTDGKLTSILTAKRNSTTAEFKLDYYSASSGFFSRTYMINNFYNVPAGNPIFIVPSDKTKDENYYISSIKNLPESRSYNIYLYDVDERYNAKATLITNLESVTEGYLSSASSINERPMVVQSVENSIDGNGEDIRVIRGFVNGVETSHTLKASLSDKVVNPGDVVYFSFDNNSLISNLYVRCSYKTNTLYTTLTAPPGYSESNSSVCPEVLSFYGVADSIIGGSTVIATAGTIPRRFDFGSGITDVYLFDSSRNMLIIADFDDIAPGDTIYAHYHRGVAYEIVIYR